MGQKEDSEGDTARPGLSSPQRARDVEAQRPHICQCTQPALPPSTRSQPPSTTQALSKAPSAAREALGRVGLLMPPGQLPAQASEETGAFFSDKQQQMATAWPGLQAGTRERAGQDRGILILRTQCWWRWQEQWTGRDSDQRRFQPQGLLPVGFFLPTMLSV